MDLSNMNLIRPMNPDEVAALAREEMARNEERDRQQRAAANRAAGKAEPRPGDKLFVQTARGIKSRSRAGIRFDQERRIEVLVVGEDAEPRPGAVTTTVAGAEEIIGDDSLVVYQTQATEADAMELRAENERLAQEVKKLTEQNRLLREARMSAPESKHGEPSRLRAAQRAKAKDGDDFGGGNG